MREDLESWEQALHGKTRLKSGAVLPLLLLSFSSPSPLLLISSLFRAQPNLDPSNDHAVDARGCRQVLRGLRKGEPVRPLDPRELVSHSRLTTRASKGMLSSPLPSPPLCSFLYRLLYFFYLYVHNTNASFPFFSFFFLVFHFLFCFVLFCFVLFCFVLFLFCFVLFCFCFVLFCFVLFCFVLFCFVLFCFVLFCFVLFCFVLFCFVLFFFFSFPLLKTTREGTRCKDTMDPSDRPSSQRFLPLVCKKICSLRNLVCSASYYSYYYKILFIVSFLGSYWAKPGKKKMYFDKIASKFGFDPLVAKNWYTLKPKQIQVELVHLHPSCSLPYPSLPFPSHPISFLSSGNNISFFFLLC